MEAEACTHLLSHNQTSIRVFREQLLIVNQDVTLSNAFIGLFIGLCKENPIERPSLSERRVKNAAEIVNR